MKSMHLTGPMPYYTNCYIVISDAGHAAVIDPACSADQVNEVLAKEGASLTHILLTHGHFDHTYGLPSVQKAWPEAKLYMCPEDAQGNRYYPPRTYDVALDDEDVIHMDEVEFKIWRTPGHTPGSCCILCGDLFFTGDTMFHMSIGRSDLPGGDPAQMMASLAKLKALPVAGKVQVLPGHMDSSTLAYERDHNPYLQNV